MTPKYKQPAHRRNWLLFALALAGSACIATAAAAQAWDDDPADVAETAAPDEALPTDIDWSVLNSDPTSPYESPAAIKRKAATGPMGDGWSWSRADKPNGSSSVAIKQPISPFWDTRVGADLNVATQMPTTSSEVLAERIAHGSDAARSSGSAWAAMTAPGVASIWDKTAIKASTDPAQAHSSFGTSLSKAIPFGGDRYSLTLQSGYNLTQQTLVPLFGFGGSSRVVETDQSAKLGIAETGTSFIASQTHSSTEDKWLRRITAEQKLFGGVTIAGSVSETPDGAADRSLMAGFKHHW